MSSIPCIAWAKRGATVGRPQKVKLTEEELVNLVNAEIDDLSDNEDDSKTNSSSDNDCDDSDDIDKKYGLGDYEKESKTNKHGLSLKNLIWQRQDVQDQYLIEDDEESEDGEIQPDDNILAIGRVKNDIFGLEAYVYNETSSSLFCHHDTILSSFPLAMEWVGYDPGEDAPGNLLAVGTVMPQIELWDLDVINTLEPAFILGETNKKQDKQKSGTSRDCHTDAVLALSWNALQQNALASGSADFTVGLWDLEEGKMVVCIDQHEEKVQALQWHPFEKELLLSGSFDKTARVLDCRYSEASGKSWSLSGEVEKVVWNARQPFYFMASTDDGIVNCFDVRTESPVFTVKAHRDAVTGLAISSELPGCMVTTSSDQLIKVWDIRSNEPDMVCQVNLGVGQIHSMAPCPDSGFIYAIGAESDLRIFHLKTLDKVLTRWNLDAIPGRKNKKPKMIDSDMDTSDSDLESTEDGLSEGSYKNDSDTCSVDNEDYEQKLDINDKHNQGKHLSGKNEKSHHRNTKTTNKQEKKLKNSKNEKDDTTEIFTSKKKKNKVQDADESSHAMTNCKKKHKPLSIRDEKQVAGEFNKDDSHVKKKKKKKKASAENCLDQVEEFSKKKSCKSVLTEKKKKSLKRVYDDGSSDVSHPENAAPHSSGSNLLEASSSELCHEVKLKKGKKKSKKKGHLHS